MSDRSPSHGRSELWASDSASSSSATAVDVLASLYRATPSRKTISARSTSEKTEPSVSAARGVEQVDRRANVPSCSPPRPRPSGRGRRARPSSSPTRPRARPRRRRRPPCSGMPSKRLGAREQGLDPAALVRRDPAREEGGIDVQALRQPLHRLGGRTGLAPLDLADVLLREAVSGELRLRQPGGDAEEAEAVAQPRARGGGEWMRWAAVVSVMGTAYLGSREHLG